MFKDKRDLIEKLQELTQNGELYEKWDDPRKPTVKLLQFHSIIYLLPCILYN